MFVYKVLTLHSSDKVKTLYTNIVHQHKKLQQNYMFVNNNKNLYVQVMTILMSLSRHGSAFVYRDSMGVLASLTYI